MSRAGELARRVWYSLNRKRFDALLDSEMAAHRDMLRDPRRFGNALRLRESAQDVWALRWLEDGKRDLNLAARALGKSPGFTVVAIASLALGLALSATTMAVANAYLIRSIPYPGAERLFHVMYAPPGPFEPGGMSALDWSAVSDVVEYPVTSSGAAFFLSGEHSARQLRAVRVNAGFIKALGIRPIIGRPLVESDFALNAEPLVLIGDALWRTRFGADSSVVGRVVTFEVGEPGGSVETFRVAGVLPRGFWYGRESSSIVDAIVPLRARVRTYMVKLRDGVLPLSAELRITQAAREVGSEIPADWTGVHLEGVGERYTREIRPVLRGLTVAAILVLAIACTNVSVLVFLRALRRQKEMAIRVALGAGRKHLTRMLVAESALLCGGAVAATFVISRVALKVLTPTIEAQLQRPAPTGVATIGLDPLVLGLLMATGLFVTIALSFLPLLTVWSDRLGSALRQGGRAVGSGITMRRVRTGLIAFEFAGSLALLVGCGLMIRSVSEMVRTDLGYHVDGLARVRLVVPQRAYADGVTRQTFLRRITNAIAARADTRVAYTSWPPFAEGLSRPFVVDDGREYRAGASGAGAGLTVVGPDYFTLLGIPLREGRGFTNDDVAGSEPAAMVSASLAKELWPDASAVGHRIRTSGPTTAAATSEWRTIIGVVGDVRQTYADAERRDIYLPVYQVPPDRFMTLYIRSRESPAAIDSAMRAVLASTDPRAELRDVSRVADEDRRLAGARFVRVLLTVFAGFAGFLAVVGLYGVIAYAVTQRRREFAVRIALGSTRRAVIELSMRDGARLLTIGLAGGLVIAASATQLLRNQLYGVGPLDVATLVGSSVTLGAAGLVAIWWPARRGASIDPMIALDDG